MPCAAAKGTQAKVSPKYQGLIKLTHTFPIPTPFLFQKPECIYTLDDIIGRVLGIEAKLLVERNVRR